MPLLFVPLLSTIGEKSTKCAGVIHPLLQILLSEKSSNMIKLLYTSGFRIVLSTGSGIPKAKISTDSTGNDCEIRQTITNLKDQYKMSE